MLHHNFLFNSVISDPSDCVSTEEMEEIICKQSAIDAFEIEYGLVLTKEEKMAIKEGASCGEGFVGEAWTAILNLITGENLSEEDIELLVNSLVDTEEKRDLMEYFSLISEIREADSSIRWDRSIELYNLIENGDDNVLISDCTDDVTPWIDLASFVIPMEAKDRLISLGWESQDIEQGNSRTVNLDYHSVTIDQLPDIDGDGVATKEELFNNLKLNFAEYANAQFEVNINNGPDFDVAATWSFFQNDYEEFWETDSPENTILDIDTKTNPDGWMPSGLTDDATVICSSYDNGCCWVFSTVWANQFGSSSNGSHPVSGNRQFGIKTLANGKYEFYVKAADRSRINFIVSLLANKTGNDASEIFYDITDKTWNSLTKSVSTMVNGNGGISEQNSPLIIRPKWSAVKDKLKSAFPLTSIPCE